MSRISMKKMKNIQRKTAALAALIAALAACVLVMAGCGKSYEHTFGDLEWYATYRSDPSDKEIRTIKDTYYYSDDWFSGDPSADNEELALASMQLAASAAVDDPDGIGADFLKSMGFDETGFSDFKSSDPDDCNYTWAKKTVDDKGFTVIAVVIQSSTDDRKIRNKAWKQNFTVNDPSSDDPQGEHYEYAKVVDNIVDDIAALADADKVKYWITGVSRAGAITNVLAARLPEKLESKDAKIFAYTFEAPATVDAETAAKGNYKYIHNYVCSNDIVTKVPMWGMTRYGDTHELVDKKTETELTDELARLGSDAAELKPRIVIQDAVDRLSANMEARVPSRADYSKVRTEKWKDSDGKEHEVTYSYQDALVKLMDLVFRDDTSVSLLSGLSSRKDELLDSVDHLAEGIKLERNGKDPYAEYWAGTESIYKTLKEIVGDEGLPISEEDLYKVVNFAAPVVIEVPEDGGEPDTELLVDIVGYNKELTYSHMSDTLVARLKLLAPTPES